MITLDRLTKKFGPIHAVDGISLNILRGEVLGFLGPNGAGKTTTMRMITGFLPPTSGTAMVGNNDVSKAPIAVRKMIGYLPEGAPLYGDMTPAAFLDFVGGMRGFQGQKLAKQKEWAVETLQLERVLHQPIDTLSKGYKRRVGLAQAILHDPDVLILDEPTDGLDPNQKHQVRTLIRSMAKEKAIIISTHILEEVEAVCTRSVVISGGRVVFDGTPRELQRRCIPPQRGRHTARGRSGRPAGPGGFVSARGRPDREGAGDRRPDHPDGRRQGAASDSPRCQRMRPGQRPWPSKKFTVNAVIFRKSSAS